MLSYDQVGAAAFLSRALAGIYRGRAVFSLPGAVPAVTLGMKKLILPELAHLAYEISKPPLRRLKTR
jgi:molybdenum cofactor biosynthesis protein B